MSRCPTSRRSNGILHPMSALLPVAFSCFTLRTTECIGQLHKHDQKAQCEGWRHPPLHRPYTRVHRLEYPGDSENARVRITAALPPV